MPYTLRDFPKTTHDPKIEVELLAGDSPEGTKYSFELIVEDSAGIRSLVDTVTITVVKKPLPPPEVIKIEPDFVILGKPTNATIYGRNLATLKAVQFLQGDDLEPRVYAVIDSKKDDQALVTIEALERTPVEHPYSVEVLTQAGRARWEKAFTVVRKPQVEDFAPKSLGVGEQADPFIIRGHYLRMEDLHPPTVHFLDHGQVDPHFAVEISPESTAETLVLVVTARNDDGRLRPGDRHLRITTRGGEAIASAMFQVTWP